MDAASTDTTPDHITAPAEGLDAGMLAELHAIQVATEALAAIEDKDAQIRVVRYLCDRFGLTWSKLFPHLLDR